MAPENIHAAGRVLEVHVSELAGQALNWSVFCAIYKGMQPTINVVEASEHKMPGAMKPLQVPGHVSLSYTGAYGVECRWNPQGDWDNGGPLIDKHVLQLKFYAAESPETAWRSETHDSWAEGPTPLIATCRAIVAAHLGEVVSVPAELVENISRQ